VRDDAWRWKMSSWYNLEKYEDGMSVMFLEECANVAFAVALIDS